LDIIGLAYISEVYSYFSEILLKNLREGISEKL